MSRPFLNLFLVFIGLSSVISCQDQASSKLDGSMVLVEDTWVAFWVEDNVNVIIRECATFVSNDKFSEMIASASKSEKGATDPKIFQEICQKKADGKFGQYAVFEEVFREHLMKVLGANELSGFNNRAIAKIQKDYTKVGPGRAAVKKQEEDSSGLIKSISESQTALERIAIELTRMEREIKEIVDVAEFGEVDEETLRQVDAAQNNKYSKKLAEQKQVQDNLASAQQQLATLPIDVVARTEEYNRYEEQMTQVIDALMYELADRQVEDGKALVLNKHSRFSQYKESVPNSGNHSFIILSALVEAYGSKWQALADSSSEALRSAGVAPSLPASGQPVAEAYPSAKLVDVNAGARFKIGSVLANSSDDSGVIVKEKLIDTCNTELAAGDKITGLGTYAIRNLKDLRAVLDTVTEPVQPVAYVSAYYTRNPAKDFTGTFQLSHGRKLCLDASTHSYRADIDSKWELGYYFEHVDNRFRKSGEPAAVIAVRAQGIKPGTPAQLAGLRDGDQFIKCGVDRNEPTVTIRSLWDLRYCMNAVDGAEMSLLVRAPDGTERTLYAIPRIQVQD